MRKSIILFIAICQLSILNCHLSIAQNDTTLKRIVTVERDFQPVIQSAGKINQRPNILSTEIPLAPVIYSTYTDSLSIGHTLNPLQVADARFVSQAPLNGILEAAGGYRNTHFLFGYQIHQKKKMSLDLYANHDAYWGKDALSESQLGMQVTRHFSGTDFYFGIEGDNQAYSYRHDNQTAYFPWRSLWNAKANLGLRSTSKAPVQYLLQTGYNAFIVEQFAVEHQVQSHLNLHWSNNTHSAGVKAYVQNNFYSSFDTSLTYSPRHAFRIEPFYAYDDKHIHLHVGVNLNMNIGTGTQLSTVENLSFAPSPNVQFEWNMMDNIFHIYAHATGRYALGSLEEYLGYNRYLNIAQGLAWREPRAYTPVDAQLGIKLRPTRTLLIDIYGGYAYQLNAYNMKAILDATETVTDYQMWLQDIQQWKVGANLHYHYRDIIEVNMGGNYYFYTTTVFDRPKWDAYARIEAHIDSKWSVYSENYFAGTREAYIAPYMSTTLRPVVSLNIGGQYAINRWLAVYAQVNDYLNRKHDIFYGYKSQGIHFLLGVKWQF